MSEPPAVYFCKMNGIFATKTAHYVSVYEAVLTIFMLYVYAQNIDTILKRRQVKKAIAKIAATQAK